MRMSRNRGPCIILVSASGEQELPVQFVDECYAAGLIAGVANVATL
jgi:hypothetical protein